MIRAPPKKRVFPKVLQRSVECFESFVMAHSSFVPYGTLHCLRRVSFADGCLILQVGLLVKLRLSGIENADCAVLPFDKRCAAMPLLATARQ